MALATVQQMGARLDGGIASADEPRAEAALDDASAFILALVDDDTVTAWESEAPAAVVAVACQAAIRGFLNPHGIESERQGDYQYDLASATGVYLTEAERRVVLKASGKGTVRAIETTHPYGFTYDPHWWHQGAEDVL